MDEAAALQSLDPEDGFHNGFHYFLEAVTILSSAPEAQCQAVGDYNVAWELKSDVLAGAHLLRLNFLEPSEEDAVRTLVEAVDAVDVSTMSGGEGRESNLLAMRDSAWAPLRILAKTTLEQLGTAAQRTARYFEQRANAI